MDAHAPTSFERMSTLRRELATPPSENAGMMRNWRAKIVGMRLGPKTVESLW
jgi:hypothetical protein